MLSQLKRAVGWHDFQFPSRQWVKEAEDETFYTPDIATLADTEFQLLFVHDDMQKGMDLYHLIEDYSVPVYGAFTKKKFTVLKKLLGKKSFPIALEGELLDLVPAARVKGTLYSIQSYRIPVLDRCRENGVVFNRVRVSIEVPYRKGHHSFVQEVERVGAWMYVGKPEYWTDLVGDGYRPRWDYFHPVETYTPKGVTAKNRSDYFNFTPKELLP